MTVIRPLTKLLTSPSKVAHALDWAKATGGTLLSLSIHRDAIDLAVSSHPSTGVLAQPLPSVPLHRTSTPVLTPSASSSGDMSDAGGATEPHPHHFHPHRTLINSAVATELETIVRQWNACGLVVHWPIQREGWCGAPCGRVLFALDHLTSSTVLNRPTCLWDGTAKHQHHLSHDYEDEWGRSPYYSEVPHHTKTVHYASEEQYIASPTPADQVWEDFAKAHWPEHQQNRRTHSRSLQASSSQKQSQLSSKPKSPTRTATAATASAPTRSTPAPAGSKPWLSSHATATLSSKYDAAWLDDDLP